MLVYGAMLGKVISQNGYISFISVFDVNMSHIEMSQKAQKNRRKLDESENNTTDPKTFIIIPN